MQAVFYSLLYFQLWDNSHNIVGAQCIILEYTKVLLGALVATANSVGVIALSWHKELWLQPFPRSDCLIFVRLRTYEEKWVATFTGNIKKRCISLSGEFYFWWGNRINMLYWNNCWVELLKSSSIPLLVLKLTLSLSTYTYLYFKILY